MNTFISIILYILGILLMLVIFWQAPKQETLGTAFSAIHKTKVEKVLTAVTFIVMLLICVVLILVKHL